jgi:hypothetical protein
MSHGKYAKKWLLTLRYLCKVLRSGNGLVYMAERFDLATRDIRAVLMTTNPKAAANITPIVRNIDNHSGW